MVIFIPMMIIGIMLEPKPEKIVESGRPIAQAISNYRSDRGLYPLVLEELVPAYLPSLEKSAWRWDIGGTSLRHPGGQPHSDVRFVFGESYYYQCTNAWVFIGDSGRIRVLSIPPPRFKSSTLSPEAAFEVHLNSREERIARSPKDLRLYADKISVLAFAGEEERLRQECQRAATLFPDWWFPELVLANLEDDYAKRFEAWLQKHDTSNNHWFLARLHRDRGNVPAALETLKRGIESQLIREPGDSAWDRAYILWDATKLAYDNRDYDLTLKLAERWEKSGRVSGEMEWLALRTAARLTLGQFESLEADASRYANAKQDGDEYKSATQLLEAVRARNTNYVYDADAPSGQPWALFPKPSP
jgi:hypothetical protein